MYEPANTLSATPLTDRINTLVAAFAAELTTPIRPSRRFHCCAKTFEGTQSEIFLAHDAQCP